MLSAVLILILLTSLVIYATQVGVFEQRKSGNELRQKQAFHAAELGIQYAQEYMLSYILDLAGDDSEDGWLSDTFVSAGGSGRWVKCPSLTGAGDHPCYGEPKDSGSDIDLRGSSYFYSLDGANPSSIPLLVNDIRPYST